MMAAYSLPAEFSLTSLLDGLVDPVHIQDIHVSGLAIDSRKVNPGDIFVAYSVGGISNISYIDDAIKAGATIILADDQELTGFNSGSVPVITVKGLFKIIGVIADRLHQHPSADMTVIGVTGTNGKTSVSHLLAQCLTRLSKRDCGVIGTLGYGVIDNLDPGPNTTPDPVTLHNLLSELRNRNTRHVVMEVSSHGLDQFRVAGVNFDLAVFTNLSRDHLDYHISFQDYAKAKQRLFTEYGIVKQVINIDDDFGQKLFRDKPEDVHAIACTLNSNNFDSAKNRDYLVFTKITNMQLRMMSLEIFSPWGNVNLSTGLTGQFNAHNILSVFSTLCMLGFSIEESAGTLSGCKNIPGRMECFGDKTTPQVVIDYAHTPDALAQVLETLKLVCDGSLYCVFGCGGDRDRGKRSIMAAVAETHADFITLTSDNPRYEDPEKIIEEILSGMSGKSIVEIELDRERAIQKTVSKASVNDIVLIAGKGHENYQEIAGVRRPFSDQQVVIKTMRGQA